MMKVEGKCVPVHDIKAYTGSKHIFPLILKLGARRRTVVNFSPGRFTLGKNPGTH
jgi:hypothetical protein